MNQDKGGKASFGTVPKKATKATIALFTVVVLESALGCFAQTAVNPMIPALSAEFGIGLGLMQWVATGYILVLGITVPIATYLSRRVSIRVHMLIGSVLFIAGCVIDALAQTFAGLVVGRVLQATSIGILMPLMQVVAVVGFPPNRRATAMGVGGIALGFAPNVGPTVGAAVETAFGWRAFFVILAAITIALTIITLFAVRKGESQNPSAKFDFISFLFSSLGFGALLVGVSNASSAVDYLLQVLVPIAVGVVFVVLFVRRQAKVPEPLMHLQIFESKQFNRGLIALVLHFSAFLGVTLLIPLWVQNLRGGTSLDAGMVLLPAMVIALIINPLSGVLHDRFGLRPVVIAMGLFLLVGAVLEVTATETTPFEVMAVYQGVRQVGIGGLIGPLQTWALVDLKGPLISDGSSTCILFRQVGSSIGAAIMVFLVSFGLTLALPPAVPYQAAFAFSGLLVLVECAFLLRYVR